MSQAILQSSPGIPAGGELTAARSVKLALFSSAVWFGAALFIRFAGPHGIFEGWKAVATYLITIPATIPLSARALKIAGLKMPLMPAVIAVTTAVASIEDGVAMRLVPGLYGGDPAIIQAGAIWLLWAIGIAAALSVIVSAKRRRP
jgi:hypothetical protein